MTDVLLAAWRTGSALALRPEVLGPALTMAITIVGLLVTWAFLSVYYTPYKQAFESEETVLIIRVENFVGATGNVILKVPASAVDAFFSVIQTIQANWSNLLLLAMVGAASVVWLDNAPFLIESVTRMRQCQLVPFLEDYLLWLVNWAQFMYSSLYPLADAVFEGIYFFSGAGMLKVLRQCTDFDDFSSHFATLADALSTFFDDLGDFFADGGFFTNRLSLVPSLTYLGDFANTLLTPLNCFCAYLNPVWVFLVGVVQQMSLYLMIEYAANAFIRAGQFALTFLTTLTIPLFSPVATELVGFVLALASFIEDVTRLLEQMLYNIFQEILDAVEPLASTVAVSLQLMAAPTPVDPAGWDEGVLPVKELEVSPQPDLSLLFHASLRTWGSPLASGTFDVYESTPIWSLPPDSNLGDLLGLPRLLQLLGTPWAHYPGEVVAAAIVVANMTVNVIFHPTDAFGSVDGQAYFDFREPFDHLRAAVSALTSLLVLFEDHLPCWAGDLGQAYVTYVEAILELFRIVIYAIIFPHYEPGPDPPYDCHTAGVCAYPVTDGWTLFQVFPAYYDWEDNGLRPALHYLQDDADCMALTLGCDNATLPDDNCTELPFQCALRTSYLTAIEVVNLTLTFVFYLPDIVRFDKPDGYRDASDINVQPLFDYLNDFIECLVTWYVFFFCIHTYTYTHK